MRRWPQEPIRIEAVTDELGIARATFTAGPVPAEVRMAVEVVNVREKSGLPPLRLAAVITPTQESMNALVEALQTVVESGPS